MTRNYDGQTLRDQLITLDGGSFVDTVFENCAISYEGGEVPKLSGAVFRNVAFGLMGAAVNTMDFYVRLNHWRTEYAEKLYHDVANQIQLADRWKYPYPGPPRPPVLYKFRNFPTTVGVTGHRLTQAQEARQWAYETLKEGKIYFSKPENFNDAFEFRTRLVPWPSDKAERERLMSEFLRHLSDRALAEGKITEARAQSWQRAGYAGFAANFAEAMLLEEVEATRESARVYCVSAAAGGLLQWAHYADGQRGVALHFDSSKAPFAHAVPVAYSRGVPPIEPPKDFSDETWKRFLSSLMYVKHTDWSYEEEWRLSFPLGAIKPLTDEQLQEGGIRLVGGAVFVEPTTIVGVTLGAKMPRDAREELILFLRQHRPDIKIYEAFLVEGKYAVQTRPIP